MGNSHLSVLITRIKKQKNRLVYINELKEQFEKTLGDAYTEKKWYKLIYHLKNKWYLISLKKDIFCFTTPDFTTTESELLLNRYWLILEHHLEHYWKKHYIGWIKALELHQILFLVILLTYLLISWILFLDCWILKLKYIWR